MLLYHDPFYFIIDLLSKLRTSTYPYNIVSHSYLRETNCFKKYYGIIVYCFLYNKLTKNTYISREFVMLAEWAFPNLFSVANIIDWRVKISYYRYYR